MRKKTSPIAMWNKNLKLHRKQFDHCVAFLKQNTDTVSQFHHQSMLKLFSNIPSAKHRLYFVFVDCLNAAGGSNLTASAEGTREFLKVLNKFGDEPTISFAKFLELISAQPQNSIGLFEVLTSGRFKNFGKKKAALFIRQIWICQKDESLKLFKDLSPDNIDKQIPLDIVIADLCSKLLHLRKENKIDPSKHFDDFNIWARSTLNNDYFLFEDLWYWGYFTTTVDGEKERKVGVNDDKYTTNVWFYPEIENDDFKKTLNKFCELFKMN